MRNLIASVATAAMLTLPAAGTAQNETWADEVNENDSRAVGYVITVEDDSFDLRTHSDGVMTFAIPQDRDYSADLQIGNRVQVFYNPTSTSVSFIEIYSEPIAENGTTGNMATETDIENESELEAEAEEAMAEAEAELEEAGNEVEEAWNETEEQAEQAWQETREEAREFGDEVETATENAFDGDDYEAENSYETRTYDSDELPQTASNLPLILVAGALLSLIGAAALRWSR